MMENKEVINRLEKINTNLTGSLRRTNILEGGMERMVTNHKWFGYITGVAITVAMGVIGWLLSLQLHIVLN